MQKRLYTRTIICDEIDIVRLDNNNGESPMEASETVKKVSTSMNLDEDLWLKVRMLALTRKITATELVEEALLDVLNKYENA